MATATDYADKDKAYFTGERRDLIDRLSPDPTRAILEIGCGDGATGRYARDQGKCGRYVGIELFPEAAALARAVLDEVHVANVETFAPPWPVASFDVLIASEVLEHLANPVEVLKVLRSVLRPGAQVYASSPNVAHKSAIAMLLKGDWRLEDRGRMDRTHLRWFTPRSYAAMFEECGYLVDEVAPLVAPGWKAGLINLLTGGRFAYLFMSQIVLAARVPGGQKESAWQ